MKIGRTIAGMALVWAWCLIAPGQAHTANPARGSAIPSGSRVAQANPQVATCPPGMVLANETNCCWPGQRFSSAHGTCQGIPVCPAGMVAVNASCVPAPPPPSVVAPPPAPPAAPAAAPVGSSPPRPGYPPPMAGPSPVPPVAGGPGACFPPCRAGYLCWSGQCVSACNPPCGLGEQCAAGGVCVRSSVDPMGAGAGLNVTGSGGAVKPDGWAGTAGYLGIGTMVLLGGLTVAIVVNNDDEEIAIPLGIGATVFGGAMIPIVAAGGASSRTNHIAQGYPGLRLASWIVYGLAMADATVAIGLALSDVSVPSAVAGSIGALGVLSATGMTLDAFASASSTGPSISSSKPADGLALTPFFGPVGRELHGMVLGVRGSL